MSNNKTIANNGKYWAIIDSVDDFFLSRKAGGYEWSEDLDQYVLRFSSSEEAQSYLEDNEEDLSDLIEDFSTLGVTNCKDEPPSKAAPPTKLASMRRDPPKVGITSHLKSLALQGLQLGVGLRVAVILQTHTTKALRKAKVPAALLDHPMTQKAILVVVPVTLSILVPLAPKLKMPATAQTLIESAATAAIAQVTEDFSKIAMGFLGPAIKDIMKLKSKNLEKITQA